METQPVGNISGHSKVSASVFIAAVCGPVGDRYIEVRTLPDGAQKWFQSGKAAVSYAQTRSNTSDVYFGVALREDDCDR